MTKKTTLLDIAKKLNVSKTLVSLVLNGKGKQYRINPETSGKVLALAKKLNYKPNQMARGLRTGKSKTIGLIVSDISNPLFASLCRHIEDLAESNDYHVVMASSDENPRRLRTAIETLLSKNMDGFVIVPTERSLASLQFLASRKKPFVCIDRTPEKNRYSYVTSDNYKGAFNGVQKLIEKGYRKIAFAGLSNYLSNHNERFRGYMDALKYNHLEADPGLIVRMPFHSLKKEMRSAMEALLLQHPDALFFANNTLAIEGLTVLHESSLFLPVCTFDNDPSFFFYQGSMAVIEQSFRKMAEEAMNMLNEKIKKLSSTEKQITIETTYREIH